MSDQFKPLPLGSDDFRAIQLFKSYCQVQRNDKLRYEGKPQAGPIDTAAIMVVNRDLNDGKIDIVYHKPEESFFCGARVDLNSHEMTARAGISETRTIRSEAHMALSEACTLARHLVGDSEAGLDQCSDDAVSPELIQEKVLDSSSVEKFYNYCEAKLKEKSLEKGLGEPLIPFDMDRVRVINPDNIDPEYYLRYESEGQDFVCEATVDAQLHQMWIRHSGYQNYRDGLSSETGITVEMTDACTLTANLIGPEKLSDDCHDKTQAERDRDFYTNVAFNLLVTGLSTYSLYKMGQKLFPKIRRGFFPGLRMAGNALLAGWIFDKATGIFVSKDNPLRKYGYYGALATGALAPLLWKRLVGSQLGKAIGERILSHRLLGPALEWMGGARLGARFLGVMALDLGIRWLFVDGDYDASLNTRVTDEIYDEHVYSSHWSDWFVLPLLVRGVRAASRELAPSAVEWAVGNDHEDIKDRLKKEDREKCHEGKEFMKRILPQLLASTQFYNPTDPSSYQRIQLEKLETPIQLTFLENVLSRNLESMTPEVVQRNFHISAERYEEMFQHIMLKNIQDLAAFMVFVRQKTIRIEPSTKVVGQIDIIPETTNDWARYIFKSDGTLLPGQAPVLLYELFKEDKSGMAPAEQIAQARKIQVIAAYLNQETTFGGHPMESVASAAHIFDDTGNLKIDGAFLTALSIYASETASSREPRRLKILEELQTQLQWRYLRAGPYSREGIGDALKVLGIPLPT